ncbi:MBL fold metallo-hydrolase [Methanocella sp. CWC-04]|uniref:MBL fold metallo-hydrolase n=1 Tax=Methanooceanicella nereidis TaxID=2052831 RepID=A0AAP2W656_9EURY|nr:FprA family A-type flavoprotein [Methanocella sp. CWC-04]MCD1296355.1 MBL fold metallo-hydrolase [Methanocella sp. CWC-04]
MNHEVKNGIYWVGAIDWDLRDFHGYSTPKGTTYNAYLIVDEKIALVDTVRQGFFDEMLMRVSGIVEPEKVDYLIIDHLEKDHSGSIEDAMKVFKNAKIISSERGKKGLDEWYDNKWPIIVVKTGSTLSLGKKTLKFLETPMLHWPDNMMTYAEEDRVLISSDAFGQHIASSQRFENDMHYDIREDARTYYANILMPFAPLILKLLDKVKDVNIQPEIIAPAHGLIWRSPEKILEAYKRWSMFESGPKIVIAYDTMWGTSSRMARLIAIGAIDEGVEVRMYDIRKSHISEIVSDLQDARAFALGSPTLNNGMFTSVGALLTYLKGLKPKNKIGVGFGGYGWAGGAVKEITEALKSMGLDTIEPGFQVKYVMKKDDEKECIDLGRRIAKRIKE